MRVLTTGQAADALQTSKDTVRRLIKDGDLKAERLREDGQFRIREADLRAYAERRGVVLLLDAQSAQ
jgi:excisionase family DNA binding protein